MDTSNLFDYISFLVVGITIVMTVAVMWMWGLYLSKTENPPPRSRFLLVLCIKSTIIAIAEYPLAWLAVWRLDPIRPSLGVYGGLILTLVVLVLAIAPLFTIGYLWVVRWTRRRAGGRATPPPFGPTD